MNVDVLISGGGMVGASLACALGQHGFRVAVIEAKEPKPFDPQSEIELRVSAISPGSEALLRAVQAWPLIQQRRLCPYQRMHVWDAAGEGAIEFDAVDLGEPYLGHIVENHIIQGALIERLQTLESVSWCCPDGLKRVEFSAEQVEVELESGGRLTAGLLIGADGPMSRVRKLAGIEFHAHSYSQAAVVANVQTEHFHEYAAWQRFLGKGPLAFLPLENGQCAIVWTTTPRQADRLVNQADEQFCAALAVASDFRLGKILSASSRSSFPLRGGQAYPYVNSRIALIGDAAHSIHPLAGQGVNLGFKDVATLFDVLVKAPKDFGKLPVLRRYERARKGDNLLTMRAMEGLNILFASRMSPVVWLRNWGMNLTDALTPVKRSFMRYAMGITSGALSVD